MPDCDDFEQKIIEAIYRGACDESALQSAVELIARYFDRPGAFLCQIDRAAPNDQFTIGLGTIDQAFMNDYATYADVDPAPERFSALPTGTATTTDRMFSAEFLRNNIFLHEFLRPHGVEGTLAVPLLSAAARFAMMALHQGTGQKPFEDDDILRLERLTSHLTRALQIRRLFMQSEMRGRTLEAIINRKPVGMIGVSADGSSLFVNDAARKIAAARDGIDIGRDGRLIVIDRTAAKRVAALEADVMRSGAGGIVRIQRLSGKLPYLVLVAPLPPTDQIMLPAKHAGILIAIHDPSRRVAATVQRIAHLLHVPLGAAKVVEALIDGTGLKDYADREGISQNTVKFHLKTAFDRTGTSSQTDLVRRALLALNDLGPYFHGLV
jgi:hypothetical protein